LGGGGVLTPQTPLGTPLLIGTVKDQDVPPLSNHLPQYD